jgi:hypothetical protein
MPSKEKINNINVECYSGYKADERPVSFNYGGKKLMVDKIIDQWRSPDADHFKVLVNDGERYLLVHDNIKDTWVLEKVF